METLIGLALKSLLIAGATLALLHFTRARSSSERSLIAHLGLVALVALPLASLALPAMHIALPEALSPAAVEAPAAATPIAIDSTVTGTTVLDKVTGPADTAAATASIDWAPYAYAAPAIALLFITLLALLRLFALRHRAQVLVDPTWLSALAHAQRRMGFKNGTALLTSNELSSPISWGLMRPVILLNDEALEATGEAEAIIAHELAHVARFDWAKLMLARVATAIFWFNPLAWVLAREAHQLREEAADDAVLAANIADTDYAQLLVGVARHECKGLLLGAHGISPGKDSLRRRVRRVLDGTLARGPAQRSWVAGFAAGMLVMAAPLAALTFAPKADTPEDALTDAAVLAADRTGATPGVIGDAVASATSAAIAAAAAHPHPDLADDIARDVEIETGKALESLRAHDRKAKDKSRAYDDAMDRAIAWKALGIDNAYAASIRAAAPTIRISDDDLVGMKAVGVSPEYLRELSRAGVATGDAGDLVGARAVGVTGDYVRSLKAVGFAGSLDDFVDVRAVGITADDVRRAKAGTRDAERLLRMKFKDIRGPRIMPGPVDPPGSIGPAPPALPEPAPDPR